MPTIEGELIQGYLQSSEHDVLTRKRSAYPHLHHRYDTFAISDRTLAPPPSSDDEGTRELVRHQR
jgi:hypothetical protein